MSRPKGMRPEKDVGTRMQPSSSIELLVDQGFGEFDGRDGGLGMQPSSSIELLSIEGSKSPIKEMEVRGLSHLCWLVVSRSKT